MLGTGKSRISLSFQKYVPWIWRIYKKNNDRIRYTGTLVAFDTGRGYTESGGFVFKSEKLFDSKLESHKNAAVVGVRCNCVIVDLTSAPSPLTISPKTWTSANYYSRTYAHVQHFFYKKSNEHTCTIMYLAFKNQRNKMNKPKGFEEWHVQNNETRLANST